MSAATASFSLAFAVFLRCGVRCFLCLPLSLSLSLSAFCSPRCRAPADPEVLELTKNLDKYGDYFLHYNKTLGKV